MISNPIYGNIKLMFQTTNQKSINQHHSAFSTQRNPALRKASMMRTWVSERYSPNTAPRGFISLAENSMWVSQPETIARGMSLCATLNYSRVGIAHSQNAIETEVGRGKTIENAKGESSISLK